MQLFNDKKERIGILTGYRNRKITHTLSTDDRELYFEYPRNGTLSGFIKNEYYIRTKTDEYVIRQKEIGEEWNAYTAQVNVEELESKVFPYGVATKEQTVKDCLNYAFEGTEWKVGICSITKKRTINIEEKTTAWNVLKQAISTYRIEIAIDSLNKVINIYERRGEDKGSYFIEGLNLKKIKLKEDTYEFYTRIIPLGKDNISIKWLTGKEYIENYQYSSKIKTLVWKDERYTNTTSLLEDGTAKLEEISKPYSAYTAEILDLAKSNPVYKNILDYKIGDTVWLVSKKAGEREKQRIVKTVEYPESPKRNTAELSNARKSFVEIQKEASEAIKGEAIEISNSKLQAVLEDYSTTTEVYSYITAAADEVKLGVTETLKNYSTTAEMRAAINVKADEITLGVSKTYSTIQETDAKVLGAKNDAITEADLSTNEKLKNYSTTAEMKAAINVKADEITLGVSETYSTVQETETKINNAKGEAITQAGTDTDTKLTKYSTTAEVKAAINVKADEITLGISKTYSTIQETETKISNAKGEAITQAGTDTDEKLKKYYTNKQTDAAIEIKAEGIYQKVNEVYESNCHDYCVNGDFSKDWENWYRQNETNAILEDYQGRKAAKITGVYYIRQTFTKLKVGNYRVKVKAATAASSAKMRISFAGTGTTVTDIVQDYRTFTCDVSVTSEGTKYLYIYSYTTGTQIYVTDIELLGESTVYSNAQFAILSDSISQEVERAQDSEETLSAAIKVNADNITLGVKKGNVSSQISVESGTVGIRSNRMTIVSDNFSVYGSGSVTATGTMTTTSGSYKNVMTSGGIKFYYESTLTGQMNGDARAVGGGGTGKVLDIEGNQKGTILSVGTTYYYALNNGLNPNSHSQRHYIGGTQYFGDTSYMDQIRWNANTSCYMNYGTLSGEGGAYSYSSFYAEGQMGCGGTKYRVVNTKNYGTVGMNAVESCAALFIDNGSCIIGEDGKGYVYLDPKYMETINEAYQYEVSATRTSNKKMEWIQKEADHFIAHGEPGATFDWIILGRQTGYQNDYIESVDIQKEEKIEYDESVFYEDDIPAMESYAMMQEYEDKIDEMATYYLEEYEREIEG